MIERSGSIPLIIGSGFRRPKNMWIKRFWIRNTEKISASLKALFLKEFGAIAPVRSPSLFLGCFPGVGRHVCRFHI
jgi:hypothetical protein